MRVFYWLCSFFSAVCLCSAGDLFPLYIVDKPTTRLVGENNIQIGFEVMESNSLLAEAVYGFTSSLDGGISLSVDNFIGYGDLELNHLPGLKLKYKILAEGISKPAFVVGMDTQGKGRYDSSADRYQIKSPGLYSIVSKSLYFNNYRALVYGGVNFTFETKDDGGINFFGGIDGMITDFTMISFELDLALNDNKKMNYGQGKGYYNIQFKNLYKEFIFCFTLKDLLGNNSFSKYARTIGLNIVYPVYW